MATSLIDHRTLLRRAYAKINWFLEVQRRRPDGYHDLTTVMQLVDLADELRFQRSDTGAIDLRCNLAELDCGPANLVVRAARALQERSRTNSGVRIDLIKRIPAGAGLGGGSSDCATTLLALRELWGLDLPDSALHEIAAGLGSDINVFLTAQLERAPLVLCEGRGEITTPLASAGTNHLVLVWPGIHASTPQVFKRAELDLQSERRPLPSALVWQNQQAQELAFNRLLEPAMAAYPEIARAMELTTEVVGAPVHLSGSGSAFFALSPSTTAARELVDPVYRALVGEFPSVMVRALCTLDQATL